MINEMNSIAAKTLGDSTSYAIYTNVYDVTLLNPMPRYIARHDNNITGDEFFGYDVWHCYEATFLLDTGHPISGILKFVYPSTTKNMIESKSMKLFLNSFDMCKLGKTVELATKKYVDIIKKALIESIGDDRIEVNFFKYSDIINNQILQNNDLLCNAETYTPDVNSDINEIYDKNYNLINQYEKTYTTKHLLFESLRSRCRHTKQKDTGVATIYISGDIAVNSETIYKHVTKIRETNEFHEFCAEKIYIGLDDGEIDNLIVGLFYTRRGSLDINPIRYNKNIDTEHLDIIMKYIDVNVLTHPSIIQ